MSERFLNEVVIPGVDYSPQDFETLSIENASCLICNATDRERLYALFLWDKLDELRQQRLVHFAPEDRLSRRLRKLVPDYRTADLSRSADDQVDLTKMTLYPDESFDVFICSHILEHIPEDRKAFSELYRITKRGGYGILMVPILLSLTHTYEDASKTTELERLHHFGQEDHVRIYSKSGFLERLESAGFKVHQLGVNYFGAAAFERYGIDAKSVLYIVER